MYILMMAAIGTTLNSLPKTQFRIRSGLEVYTIIQIRVQYTDYKSCLVSGAQRALQSV
jgi:hypothetical protein